MGKLRRVALMLDLGSPHNWHGELFSGTQRYARRSGNWRCEIDEFVQSRIPSRRDQDAPYDGIIAWATPELAKRSRLRRIPLVNVWFSSPVTNLPSVHPNLPALGRLAAEHLLQCGYRRFACLSMQRDRDQRMQQAEFKSTVKAHGFECVTATTYSDYNSNTTPRKSQAFERAIQDWIDSWTAPIGVFVAHYDFTARWVVIACQRRGLQFPDDVGLVAGDNELAIMRDLSPSLTSIRVSYEEVGHRAAELLDRLMDGQPAPENPILLDPVGTIPRQSTGYVHSGDELVSMALRYLSTSAHQPIGVADVAANVFVSRRTLERRFRDSLGRSVASEIRRLRIQRAKQLLRDSSLSLAAVAQESGFRSAQSLCEAFRREEGITPSRFREFRREAATAF